MSRVISKKRINWNANWDVSQTVNLMADVVVSEIRSGLDTKTDIKGKKFKRLKLSTVKSKKFEGYAKPSTPLFATGRMREIYVKKKATKTNLRAIVSPAQDRLKIGVYHNKGTSPYKIRPKKKGGVLVFQGSEGTVFAKSVNHPGLPQREWFGISDKAYRRMQRMFNSKLALLLRLRRGA